MVISTGFDWLKLVISWDSTSRNGAFMMIWWWFHKAWWFLLGFNPQPDPGLLRQPQFFTMFMWSRALAAVWRAFCRPHFPKVLRHHQFWSANRALATFLCTFRPHLPKVLWRHHCLTFWNANQALAAVLPGLAGSSFSTCLNNIDCTSTVRTGTRSTRTGNPKSP